MLSPELEEERIAFNERQRAFERLQAAEQSYVRATDACRAFLAEEAALRETTTTQIIARIARPHSLSLRLTAHLECPRPGRCLQM